MTTGPQEDLFGLGQNRQRAAGNQLGPAGPSPTTSMRGVSGMGTQPAVVPAAPDVGMSDVGLGFADVSVEP
jgi:hypothetical protein